ncbi:MAG: preprotein translocase subunit SecA [Bacillota bacterium]
MWNWLKNLWDTNEKELKRIAPVVEAINALEPEMKNLSDAELAAKTAEFKERLSRGESLDDLLTRVFAVVREAAWRTIGQRAFDTQLIVGVVLHEGKIAEMKTGEGKTLAAVFPSYLNALTGEGVHIVTVNDYLAKRDSEWMGAIHKFLGLSVGAILHNLDYQERKTAYNADITYGTNNEFGFDYLRDNMVFQAEEMVQRKLNFAIVDEVDSILIDEARTPLIISGQAEESTELYYKFARLVPRIRKDVDYTVDEKAHTVVVTEEGLNHVEQLLGIKNIYEDSRVDLVHHLNQALRAKELMKRDRDYVVKDGEVIIVDEFTGRLMYGRRYSDGLHQAIEAKENVRIEHESQTLASITFQNYFRMYGKLAGMTGTAETEEAEFRKIYNLPVVVIPTYLPMIRVDHPDMIYKSEEAKFKAVVEEIVQLYGRKQPVLVGTISIEKSERLSEMLKKRGIPHQVLNAKHHEREAEIVAQAGRLGAVTIATNMAGRGTDIILGGNPDAVLKSVLQSKKDLTPGQIDELKSKIRQDHKEEQRKVIELGGLHILGTERHESRRIDNQLRGRSGRQGDPGSSRFYVSLEDDLMRLFGGENISRMMGKIWEEDVTIESKFISRRIEHAQRRVEMHNFDIRKHVLEYDDVMNQQRIAVYKQRKLLLLGEDVHDTVLGMIDHLVKRYVLRYVPERSMPEECDLAGLLAELETFFLKHGSLKPGELEENNSQKLIERLRHMARACYQEREKEIPPGELRNLERLVMLKAINDYWMVHLREMDDLREGIGLRAYGQQDPLLAYKFEASRMFQEMQENIEDEVVRMLFHVRIETEDSMLAAQRARNISINRGEDGGPKVIQRQVGKKVGRNAPCPCGSGKKYKKCCGMTA